MALKKIVDMVTVTTPAKYELRPRFVAFSISKQAIRATLAVLPRLVYSEVHEALTVASTAAFDPVKIRLGEPYANHLLEWFKTAASQCPKDRTQDSQTFVDAAASLEFVIRTSAG